MDAIRTMIRPDGRCFVSFDANPVEVRGQLEELERDVYATVDEADAEARRLHEQLGFVVNRRESNYLIPTDPQITGLGGVEAADGFVLVGADRVDANRLRVLDDALRQDVPGTDGWRWDDADFREETFESSYFDPATYLLAVEEANGELAGLVRVWNNPGTPRLGLIAVLPSYRRRGLARALLARAFGVLHDRGQAEVSAEVDDANTASTTLLTGLGAHRTGGSLELIRLRGSSIETP
jgi:RimJ/RimL family protein N-acetyltransferase